MPLVIMSAYETVILEARPLNHSDGIDSGSVETAGPETRLDGWKRIAAFLNRDVRTVRRWEKNQDLPVHRLMHNTGATVYAYQNELQEWLANRDKKARTSTEPKADASRPGKARLWWLVSGLLALSLLVSYGLKERPAAGIGYTDQDWVLVTHFDNRTGDDVLDGTLEYALERELNNSRFVKVIARNRVNDALQLMKLPPETVVDLEIGRQISLRDGAIRILITGRIEKLGGTYSLSASLVNPVDGVTLTSLSRMAQNQPDILPSIARLANDVRTALGEELANSESDDPQLSRVTTPSLQALQLYSKADAMMSSGTNRARAMPLLKQAVRTDPDFASAHLMLYYLYSDRDEQGLALDHLQRAKRLAPTVSERERLFILSTDHLSRPSEFEQAIEILEILAGIYPDHFWATSNAASLNQSLHRYEQMYPYRLRRAELRPNVGWANLEAIWATLVFDDPEARAPFLQKVETLAADSSWVRANLLMLPFYKAWLRRDLDEAEIRLEQIEGEIGADDMARHPFITDHVRSGFLNLGKLEEFHRLSSLIEGVDWLEAMLEAESGRTETMDEYLNSSSGHLWDAVLLAWSGRPDEAEALILNPLPLSQTPRPYYRKNFKYLARGELAIARNDPETAISQIERSLVSFSPHSLTHSIFALNSLARAHMMAGDLESAVLALESSRGERDWSIFEPGATWLWTRNQRLLIDLYIQTGRTEDADQVTAELQQLQATVMLPGNQ
jgi:tetratricopeptide (TPR) repeat protein